MTLTFYGCAAFEMRTGDTTLLIDPFITGNPQAEGVVRADDLHADAIFLTHAHQDHLGDAPAIARRTGALVVGNYEIASYFRREYGHENVLAMNTGGFCSFDWGRVLQTDARHSSSFPDGTYGGNPNGFVFWIKGKVIYHLGDTCSFAEMAWIGEDFDVDLALVPIGDLLTMGLTDSLRAVRMIRPALTIPMHYDTFPGIEADVGEWEGLMQEAGFETRRMDFGETLAWPGH